MATRSSAAAARATQHLLLRTTYGLTADLTRTVPPAKRTAWLAAQLAPSRVADPVGDALARRYPRLAWSSATVNQRLSDGRWEVMMDLVELTLARAIWSRRQLNEVMVEFWSNHLNVTCPSSEVWDVRHRYDADVIRRHALGRYSDLLLAAVTHPAMLRYLSNDRSNKSNPNENLGRELLELHSVGVGQFTEKDVRASTLLLTGMSVDRDGAPRYRPEWHHVGALRVLGFSHANAAPDGRAAVAACVRYLATHPATARRIATKLAVRFVRDDPPKALVDRLAAIYLKKGTAIAPVLAALFTSKEFAASAGAKTRTPYENLVASVRSLGLTPPASGTEPIRGLYWASEHAGQTPLGWPQPDGYPDVAAAWQSAAGALTRWNMNSSLVGGWWPKGLGRQPARSYLPTPLPPTYGKLVDALALRIRQRPVSAAERAAILGFLRKSATSPVTARDEAITWRLEHVIALLLDAPTQLRR